VDGYWPVNFGRIATDRGDGASLGTDAESLEISELLPAGHPDSSESRFLGAPVATSPDAMRRADPVHDVRPSCPAFLILHGGPDTPIPSQQSQYLFHALEDAGNEASWFFSKT
jgi:hypothetical protein